MKQEHIDWIAANVPDFAAAYGKCAEATLAMQAAFPGLLRVRGHYLCHTWGQRQHWWLVDSNNQIIDPTAKQFPSPGNGVYSPWDETQPEPTGRCLNCGELVYDGETFCNDECSTDARLSLTHGLQ